MFKKIHEGLDLFNYYFQRHEASNNDLQREKLENDLKKEIKKLQKFRDQIKNWQLNDSIEAIIAPLKLQEHRRMVEEAMECYKEVEKNSKMKSFSNQSIMLAALDNGESDLSEEVLDTIEFLNGITEQLNEQLEELEAEYDKLSQKKIRKNNSHAIEERKQEIEHATLTHNFHLEKIDEVIMYLKAGKLTADLVDFIRDDLTFYVESNQEPDFIDDDTVYDDLIKEAQQSSKDDASKEATPDVSGPGELPEFLRSKKTPSPEPSTNPPSASSAPPTASTATSNGSLHKVLPQPVVQKKVVVTPKKPSPPVIPPIAESSDGLSPAIIKTLKPAVAPSKPVGALKWAAAAAGTPNEQESGPSLLVSNTPTPPVEKLVDPVEPLPAPISEDDPNFKYVEVLRNSALSKTELDLFSDPNMIKLPPGVQDLVVSFTATRQPASSESKLLGSSGKYDHLKTPLFKPYLPSVIQVSSSQVQVLPFKLPLNLSKLQSYWNKIRAQGQFDQFVDEIRGLSTHPNPEFLAFVNELTMVLFYGFYYGVTPLENLIAESCLFLLGWKPYGSKTVLQEEDKEASPNQKLFTKLERNHLYWFKCIKSSVPPAETQDNVEYGDYQVFDLLSWDIYVKYAFKFDVSLCQLHPSTSIC